MARSLVVTLRLQAVLRELLDGQVPVPRCCSDIAASTGMPSGTAHQILVRLEDAGWAVSREVPDPSSRWRRPKRDFLLAGEGLSLAEQALAARPAARRAQGGEPVALRALRALERIGDTASTRQVMTAAGDSDRPGRYDVVASYSKNLSAHLAAGRVRQGGTPSAYTWSITSAGRQWLAAGGASSAGTPKDERHGTGYRYDVKGCRCGQCQAFAKSRRERWKERNPDKVAVQNRQSAQWRSAHPGKARQYARRANGKVKRQNDQLRETAGQHGRPWSDAELEAVTRDDLTHAEIAALLGRTVKAVTNMRALVNQGAGHAANRAARAARQKQQNDETRETAARNGQPWTGTDLEMASRSGLARKQAAVILRRTLWSVETMRKRLSSTGDPRARGLRDGAPPTSMS